ncbi:MAG: alpha/beta hydrolase-fold protein [Candidatus Bathyarchaeota archaeon]|nr:alpha/beta hydrolase-fold protein [Candidatus Bathyarchaeota archaeon]
MIGQTEHKYAKEIKYLLYLPKTYHSDQTTRWPLLFFLHGAGERGDDLQLVKMHGPPKMLEAGKELPFIVVSPQVPTNERWLPDLVVSLLKDIFQKYRVDEDRVYLTGLSMGGYGTWETAMKYPELFAAIAPICGGGDPYTAWKIRHTPTWIFHGAKDPVVSIRNSEVMNDALTQFRNVQFTVYPEAEHDSWTETYSNDELYRWFLSHKRFKHVETSMPHELEKYIGVYSNDRNSAKVYLNDGKLNFSLMTNANLEQALKSGQNNAFFFNETTLSEVNFVKGKNGDYDTIIVYDRQSDLLKKS